jgi:membrane fusion protein (multidrug efflux system)
MIFMNVETRPMRVLLPLPTLTTATLLVGGCGKEEKKDVARPPTEVTALTVVARDVPINSVLVAQTQSSQAVNIAARVSGFLDRRVYVEGAVVKAG